MKEQTFLSVSVIALATIVVSSEAIAQGISDEIIVTATRQETALSKTPVALSAITGEGLRDAGVTNPTTLGDITPNLSIDRVNGLQITIRGVTSTDGTEKGDPSAAFLLDGVYIARPQAQEVSFFDLERVEVLRGPQGTLWGRNTTAGALNVISAKPRDQFEASIDAAYGNFDTVQTTGMINVPVSETVAVRAAVNYDRRDSYLINNSGTPFSIDPFKENLSARLSALIHIGGNAELVIRGDYSKIEGHPDNEVPTANFFTAPFVVDADPVYFDSPPKNQRAFSFPIAAQTSRDNDTWGVMGEFNWDLGGGFSLAYLGGYREFTRDEAGSALSGQNPTTFLGNYWQNSQELRLAFGEGARLHGQAGGYYFKEKSGIAFFILDPQNLGLPGFATQFGFPQDPTIAESYAFFGQASYDLTEDLHLTAGVRYSHDFKSRDGATVFDTVLPPPNDRVFLQINDAARNFSKTTWRAGVDYDVPDFGLVYFTASTGYKAGGFNDGCEIGNGPSCALPAEALFYEPETLTAYEAGFKGAFLDDLIKVNAAAFHYNYKGLQLSQVSTLCGGPCQITTNAARAKVDGVEVESSISPIEGHRLDAGFTWLDARYAEFFPAPGVSFEGKTLDRSPKYTVFAGYTYEHQVSNGGVIEAGVRTRFSGEYTLTDLTIRGQFEQPNFHKTDVTVTYRAPDDRWYLQGFAKNLENEITLSTANGQFGGTAAIQDPRTYGVRVGARI